MDDAMQTPLHDDAACELCNEGFSDSPPRRRRLQVPRGLYCRGCIIDLLGQLEQGEGGEGGESEGGSCESSMPPAPPVMGKQMLLSSATNPDESARLHSAGWQLHNAAKLGDLGKLVPLLEQWVGHQAVINWCDYDGWSPLHYASSNGRTEAVKLLLSAPLVDPDRLSKNGFTPVMAAARVGQIDAVRLLLARGVDLTKVATGGPFVGRTVLGLAQRQNRQEIATLLRLAGARLSAAEEEEERSRAEERERPERERRQREEAEAAAEAERRRERERQREEEAHFRGMLEADERERRERERERRAREVVAAARVPPAGTAEMIYFAAKSGNMATLRPLVEQWRGHAVLSWHNDNDGRYTALHVAAISGSLGVVALLCVCPGVDCNAPDQHGLTPLMFAGRWGHTECVRVLLAAPGIDINKSATSGEWRGKTALGLCTLLNKAPSAALLRAAGAGEEEETVTRGLARRVQEARRIFG